MKSIYRLTPEWQIRICAAKHFGHFMECSNNSLTAIPDFTFSRIELWISMTARQALRASKPLYDILTYLWEIMLAAAYTVPDTRNYRFHRRIREIHFVDTVLLFQFDGIFGRHHPSHENLCVVQAFFFE